VTRDGTPHANPSEILKATKRVCGKHLQLWSYRHSWPLLDGELKQSIFEVGASMMWTFYYSQVMMGWWYVQPRILIHIWPTKLDSIYLPWDHEFSQWMQSKLCFPFKHYTTLTAFQQSCPWCSTQPCMGWDDAWQGGLVQHGGDATGLDWHQVSSNAINNRLEHNKRTVQVNYSVQYKSTEPATQKKINMWFPN